MTRSSAVIVRPRSSGAPTVSRKFSPTRVTCAVTKFAPFVRGDAKFPVVEIDRHALGQRDRANAAGLLEIVADPADREAGLSFRRLTASAAARAASPSVGKPNSAVRTRSSITPLITRNGTAMPICTIAATRCTRIVWRPPPPASSFSAAIRLGRLKRTAGSKPKSTLTSRHSPAAIATPVASRSIS